MKVAAEIEYSGRLRYEEVVLWPVPDQAGAWFACYEPGNFTITVGCMNPWPKQLWDWRETSVAPACAHAMAAETQRRVNEPGPKVGAQRL